MSFQEQNAEQFEHLRVSAFPSRVDHLDHEALVCLCHVQGPRKTPDLGYSAFLTVSVSAP